MPCMIHTYTCMHVRTECIRTHKCKQYADTYVTKMQKLVRLRIHTHTVTYMYAYGHLHPDRYVRKDGLCLCTVSSQTQSRYCAYHSSDMVHIIHQIWCISFIRYCAYHSSDMVHIIHQEARISPVMCVCVCLHCGDTKFLCVLSGCLLG